MTDCIDNRVDFCINQGATWTRQVTWDIDGTPVNITGYAARMYLKRAFSDVTAAFELTTANSRIVLTTPLSGVFTMTITDEDTDLLSGEYLYDLELESGAGHFARGFVFVPSN